MNEIPKEIQVGDDLARRERRPRAPAHGGGKTWDTYLGDSGAVYERARETGEVIMTIPADTR